jgi:hypothetical protein
VEIGSSLVPRHAAQPLAIGSSSRRAVTSIAPQADARRHRALRRLHERQVRGGGERPSSSKFDRAIDLERGC